VIPYSSSTKTLRCGDFDDSRVDDIIVIMGGKDGSELIEVSLKDDWRFKQVFE
jgi:hypothetical protein